MHHDGSVDMTPGTEVLGAGPVKMLNAPNTLRRYGPQMVGTSQKDLVLINTDIVQERVILSTLRLQDRNSACPQPLRPKLPNHIIGADEQ